MNLGLLLNSLRAKQNSHEIEALLQKEDLTLEELLDFEDELIYETRNKNSHLLEFLIRNQMEKMINYITIDPTDLSNSKACYKYPFVVNELFSLECVELLDTFFNEPKLLEQIFNFLETPSLNLLLAGYFSRVIQCLLSRNSYELLSFLYEGHQHGKKLLNHLYSKSICELVEKILCCEDHGNPAYKNELLSTIDQILNIISPSSLPETSTNASILLKNLLSSKQMNSNFHEISSYLSNNVQAIRSIFEMLFQDNIIVSRSAAVVIEALVNQIACDDDMEGHTGISPLISYIVLNLDKFKESLSKENGVKVNTTYKTTITSVGENKLKVIEIIISLIKLAHEDLLDSIAESSILESITSLFINHPWNSILHNLYEKLIQCIFSSNHETLRQAIFTKAKVPQTLISLSEKKYEGNFRLGILGYVTRLANLINSNLKDNEDIEGWTDFMKTYISYRNETESKVLGGRSRMMSFDMTDHAHNENDSDAFQDMNFNCEYQLIIQEEDEYKQEATALPKVEPMHQVNNFSDVNFWKIYTNPDCLEDID